MLSDAPTQITCLAAIEPFSRFAPEDIHPDGHGYSRLRQDSPQGGMACGLSACSLIGSPGRARIPRPAGLTAARPCNTKAREKQDLAGHLVVFFWLPGQGSNLQPSG